MNKTNLLLMGAGLTVAALVRGATEFEEAVPVELAEIFLGLNGEEGGLYRDLPEDFALDAAPEGFTVLGSVDQQYGLTAYLSTALDADAATEALAGALAAAGWLRLPSLERVPDLGIRGRPPGGFPERLCHEEEGFMTITVPRPDEEPRVVSLRQNPRALQAQGCREQLESQQRINAVRGRPGGELAEYMPKLELPREGNYYGRPPGPTGGISGGGDEAETRTDLLIAWEPQMLYAHFAAQLAEQGWTQDGEWATSQLAGGSWTRQTDGLDLLGLVSIVRKGEGEGDAEEDQYNIRFRLMKVGVEASE